MSIRSVSRTCLSFLGVAAVLAWGYDLRRPPGPPIEDGIALVTWNVRNFPGGHDRRWMAVQLAALEPTVVALQEVLDPSTVSTLLPTGWSSVASTHGGRNGQHLVVAFDPARVQLRAAPHEDLGVALSPDPLPALRPAWIVPFVLADGGEFDVVVVHLKATRHGLETRQEQWERLVAALEPRSVPTVVLGDFNVAGGLDVSPGEELAKLEARLRAVDLVRLASVGGCSAYWQGVRYDAWYEPSELDLVFMDRAWVSKRDTRPTVVAGAQCQTHECKPLNSSEAYPDEGLSRGSDHCPMLVIVPSPRPSIAR